MSGKKRNFKIGLFILIGIIITVICVILFGGGKFFREKYTVETYFDQSVQGLDVGAPLKFNGVQIGNVSEIHFVFNDYKTYKQYVLVRANIFPDSVRGGGGRRLADEYDDIGTFLNELVNKGLRLELSSQGITGVAFLNMVYYEPDKFPAFNIDWEPKYPYIPSAPGSITIITKSIENLTASLENINFKQISDDVDKLLNTLNTTVEKSEVVELTKDLRILVSDLNEVSNNINKILESDDVNSSLKNFNEAMNNLNEASTKIPKILNQVNKTVINFRKLSTTQQEDIQAIVDNMRDVSENINEITETGKNYPSWLLFGNPPPRISEVKE